MGTCTLNPVKGLQRHALIRGVERKERKTTISNAVKKKVHLFFFSFCGDNVTQVGKPVARARHFRERRHCPVMVIMFIEIKNLFCK